MLFAANDGELELRRARDGKRRLNGRFPYNKRAVLSDGGRRGRPKKEVIAKRAFAHRVEDEKEDIHLLVGHDYGKPLASRNAGTLKLRDTDEALEFEATITEEMESASYVQDILAAVDSGLVGGISPGFRIPPERAVKEAEKIEVEAFDPPRGMFGATIRTILQALLYELSLVTRPAYDETQVEARNWIASESGLLVPDAGLQRALNRWRA